MKSDFEPANHLLAGIWAKKYVNHSTENTEITTAASASERVQTVEKLARVLRFCSSRAWVKTEELLCQEIFKHRIDENLIDPWKIANDSQVLFEKALKSYQEYRTPDQFSVHISPQCGRIRQAHTAVDLRVLGFLSMQFHYTSQFLLAELRPPEKAAIAQYFKVMDDHLYMPLQRSYAVAADLPINAPSLAAVQQLLPISTAVAERITDQIAALNPQHQCYTGRLNNPEVRVSSIRDVEMFQIYLCLCVLEGNIAAVQQELFPLCVMLYPPLKVHWHLVEQLILLLNQEIKKCLRPETYTTFVPMINAFSDMFIEDIFTERCILAERGLTFFDG
jgi:hypothetical protein